MSEERLRDDKAFQELSARVDLRVPSKDAAIRIVSPKLKPPMAPLAPVAPVNTPVVTPAAPVGRDWASAIDLVNEAAEAVRMADERAAAAERYSQELAQYYSEQAKASDQKIAVLERRLEASESKAREAEEWLVRFHDAIMGGFGGLLKKVS
ncbi:MAG: hypothetical protein ACLP8A_18030 [Methylovirgula sp.]